jgi:hypothetical protein
MPVTWGCFVHWSLVLWTTVRYYLSYKCKQIKVSIMINCTLIRGLALNAKFLHVENWWWNPECVSHWLIQQGPSCLIECKALFYIMYKLDWPKAKPCSSITNCKLIRSHHLFENVPYPHWQPSVSSRCYLLGNEASARNHPSLFLSHLSSLRNANLRGWWKPYSLGESSNHWCPWRCWLRGLECEIYIGFF